MLAPAPSPREAPRPIRVEVNATLGALRPLVPGLPGAQFQKCASHDDAMTLLDAPPAPVSF